MPRRFRGSFRGRSGKPVHPTTWCGQDVLAVSHTTAGTIITDLCGELDLEDFTSPTVVRMRGTLITTAVFTTNTSTSQLEIFHGIIVIDTDHSSFDSLATKDGQDRPWLWLGYDHLISEQHPSTTFTSAGAVTTDFVRHGGRAQARFYIDVKAMRRIPAESRLVLVSTFLETGAGGFDGITRGNVRALIKE